MKLKKLLLTLALFVLLGTTAFAQQTWYVNNGPSGNDGRNGLSATIPVPDDFVTGPKKTINNAISSANANDVIVVAFTGVDYGTATGEPATIQANKKLTFQATGGTVALASTSTLEIVTGALATTVTFNSGNFNLKGGLLLTSGTLVNSNGLVNVGGGTITVAAINTTTKVTGQLTFSGTVNWQYNAVYTTADEFPNTGGTINNFNSGAVAVVVKSGAAVTMTGVFNTGSTLDLGGNTWTITNTAGGGTHAVAGNVTNGTLAFQLGGAGGSTQTFNGAFTLPNVSVTTSNTNAQTLAIAQPTAITGSLSVSGLANVSTSAAFITLGTSGNTGTVLTNSGLGTVTLTGGASTTVHGSVLLSTQLSTTAGGYITFNGAGAITINGSVTNSADLTVTNAATWNGITWGRITFPDVAVTINGNVVNETTIAGAYGTTLDVDGFGVILFQNTTTAVTITGQMNNTSSTSLSGTAAPTDMSGNSLITWVNTLTSGIVRVDGGINNSSNWAGVTGANNVNNGRIVLGGAARTGASTIGTAAKPVGTITNSSQSPVNGDGNGDIIIGAGDNTASGFYGSSVGASGSVKGGYIVFGQELFNITGSVTLTRNVTGGLNVIQVGTAGLAARAVTIGGGVSNQSNNNIAFNISTTGDVAITGAVSSNTTGGTISWPNITSGAFGVGGLTVSAGTVTVPATHTPTITISGNVDISGGAVNLLNSTANPSITVTASSASFTGGTITTTGVTSLTLNCPSITLGGASGNPTFATAGTVMIIGVPAPIQLVNVAIGNANPILGGALTVNSSGLAKAVEFSGGSLRIPGLLTFQAGKVNLAGAANLIAQLAADPAFTNTAGYTTDDNARVSINATGGDPGVRGVGDFGNVEFNSQGQTTVIGNGGAGITVKGTLYLTAGPVNNSIGGQNINFNNTTVIPTIVRNAGNFTAVPTFTSNVNVTYIGGDKNSGNELPTTASYPTKLQNLTVATSIGNVAGKGVVTVGNATTVNGTINVYANQTLLLDAVALTMNGAAITLNGDIANEAAGKLVFSAATGTTVTGAGYLPNLEIAAGSTGNMIAGKAIINQLVGTDNMRNTAGDDFDPTTTAAQGTVTFITGTNNATFTLTGVAKDGSMAGAVTTAGTGNTMILGGNFVSTGTFTHAAGTINVGAFTYEQRGAAITLGSTANATFAGNGKLLFYQADATTNSVFTLTANAAGSSIAINTELNNVDATAAEDNLDLAGGPLTISGNLTITDGELNLGQNLTLTGSAFTIAAAGSESGAGILRLNPTTAPLTFTYTGTPSVANLRVSNDVNLAGTGTTLTVNTSFTHDGGVLNFGARNLTFENAFTRTVGTYAATTGYMIFNANGASWTVDQGDGFSVPNLKFSQSTAHNISLNNTSGRGSITVTGALDMVMGGQTLTTNGKLAVANLVTVNYTSGIISAAPGYAGTITLVGKAFANGTTFPAEIWPTTAGLVTSLTINGAAAANTIALPDSRTVNGGTLQLTQGTLALGTKTLTLTSGITIKRQENAIITKGTGGIVFPADNMVNLVYEPATAGNQANGAFPDADITTDIEFPSVMNNLTVTRSANVANSTLLLNSAATVNGALTVKNNLTANSQLTVLGNVTIVTDSYTNATAPVVTFAQAAPLVFGGATGQTLDVTGGQQIAWMKLNMTGTNPVLNVTGNLTVPNTGGIVFQNGIINMGTLYTLILPRPNVATYSGLGYDRTLVTGTNVGHVVGKVQREAVAGDGQAGTNGRFEFPVGTLTGKYRPAAITFTPSYVVGNPVSIVVSQVDSSPEGTTGLSAIDGGNGIRIGAYPNYYWLISTTPQSLTSTQRFDVDLTSSSADFGYPYTSEQDLRMIRRMDGTSTTNLWTMQGTAANHQNYQVVNLTDATVVLRTVSGSGGLIVQGSRFAVGIPARTPVFANAALSVAEGATTANTLQLVAVPQNSGETITSYTKVSGAAFIAVSATGLVTVTAGYTDASATAYPVVVRATTSIGLTTDMTLSVTITNTDRPAVFTAGYPTAAQTVKSGSLLSLNFPATDADGDAITYSVTGLPAGAAVSATGTFTWTPAYADVNATPYSAVINATSGTPALVTSVTIAITVQSSAVRGDANGNGTVEPIDASLILKHVVGLVETGVPLVGINFDGAAMATAPTNAVGANDAAAVLYYLGPGNASWGTFKLAPASGSVEFGKFASNKGTFSLPINVTNTSNVNSVYSEVNLGSDIDYKGITARLPEGWMVSSNVENGVLKIAMAGLTPLTDGSVAVINFGLKNPEAVVSVSGKVTMNDELSASMQAVKVREIPSDFSLSQNYPNPFNPTTNIKYALSSDARVSLVVYNILGQAVRTLVNADQEAGFYTTKWDGTNDFGSRVSSGIYIYRITAGNFVSTIKMNLLK